MRQVLVDYARARAANKRSGGADRNPHWTTSLEVESEKGLELIDLIELDGAIDALAKWDAKANADVFQKALAIPSHRDRIKNAAKRALGQ